ncbi:hypothetical protein GCM10012279_43240 [Micromonospora yangpuensis]|uniref:Beta/Gamma crystallin n=2 Tax=Micromonosporaceae TaxID=28056 RepID=A0A1C6TYB0_9ACTN|nr:hypothetical protein GCM10012279_43240 [Micromonospora yangpuensis]SCL46737.1 hypothetical protein GA0070617_0370 [Micromonospora yangpuensis]
MSVKIARVLATTVAVSVAALGTPAEAAPQNQFGTTASCYGGSVRSYFERAGSGGDAGPYRTSTRCRDINVRNASPFAVDACVIFIDQTGKCNYWTYLPAKSGWVVVATNVRDGVNFKVRFVTQRYEYEPLTAHHAY